MSRSDYISRHNRSSSSFGWVTFGLGTTAVSAAACGQGIRFGDPTIYPGGTGIYSPVTADFDGDGDIDVALAISFAPKESLDIYFNDGLGHLQQEMRIPVLLSGSFLPVAQDMDADGDIDLIWANDLSEEMLTIWYNDGNGRSGQLSHVPWLRSTSMIVSEFTGDRLKDVVYSPYDSGQLRLLTSRGDRSFEDQELFEYPDVHFKRRSMVEGDFDDDGDTDVAAVFQYDAYDGKHSHLVTLLNDGRGEFSPVSDINLPWESRRLSAFSMTIGDLDGDGDLDVAVYGGSDRQSIANSIQICMNDGQGAFSVSTDIPGTTAFPNNLVCADVDADGKLDLIFTDDGTRGVFIAHNESALRFNVLAPYFSGETGDVGTADLTGDGLFDLVHGSTDGSAFTVLVNETELTNPLLHHTSLIRGLRSTLAVSGAEPGEQVRFLYSLSGGGNSLGQAQLGGLTLDLANPIISLGSASANQRGVAVLTRTIPLGAPIGPVALQAVIRRGSQGHQSVKTPFRLTVIR